MKADFSLWIRRFLHFLMTERQFYMRSHGRVQFISLSPVTQLCLAMGAFLFFGWVAFTTVNVVFKEQIIASKERKFIEMRAAYEERVAQMEISYERLNSSLVLAQQRFLDETADFEARQAQLEQVLMQGGGLSFQLNNLRKRISSIEQREMPQGIERSNTLAMRLNDSFSPAQVSRIDLIASEEAKLAQASETGPATPFGPASLSDEVNDVPRRIAALEISQRHIVAAFEKATERHVADVEHIIDRTGIQRDAMLARLKPGKMLDAVGGPFIGLSSAKAGTMSKEDQEFDAHMTRLSENMQRLARLQLVLQAMPLDTPLDNYRVISHFGVRPDPFRRRAAYHSGLDMMATHGTAIHATAPGVVVFAGWRGAYGQAVEVDHHNGLHTLYGHLSTINVKVGDKIAYRQVVGRQGSTGRSTGSHLHYEIVYNGTRRDPAKFIEAGRYVLKTQG